MQKDKLDYLVELYISHIKEKGFDYYVKKDEGYKFDFINHFQNNFNLDAKDFYAMIKASLLKNNLTNGSFFYPRERLLYFVKKDEARVKNALICLFDKNQDIEYRINDFKKVFDDMATEDNKEIGVNKKSCIDLRFISLLLVSRYPNDYYYIKPSEYRWLGKYLFNNFIISKRTSEGEKYKILAGVGDEVLEAIKNLPEIINIHDGFVNDNNRNKYDTMVKDDNFHLTTQDFIFITGYKLNINKVARREKKKREKAQKEIISNL